LPTPPGHYGATGLDFVINGRLVLLPGTGLPWEDAHVSYPVSYCLSLRSILSLILWAAVHSLSLAFLKPA